MVINPKEKTSYQIREMFDDIASNYDPLNAIISMGMDSTWRETAARIVAGHTPHQVLDVATGTGDLAFEIGRRLVAYDPSIQITGIDLSQKMLNEAAVKAERQNLLGRTHFMVGDALAIPFSDSSFDACTCAFGVRNFTHLSHGLTEMTRILRPGGLLLILELTEPQNRLLHTGYRLYTRRILPLLATLLGADDNAYRYLPESIRHVPQRHKMLYLMRSVGLERTYLQTFPLGICTLYLGYKR